MSDLIILRDAMRTFTAERNWEHYHDPKSLILALMGEVGELSEVFQWLPADEAVHAAATDPVRQRAGAELADVLLYLVRLADVLNLDLMQVALDKMSANAQKHRPGEDPRSEQTRVRE
jgi:dCTP diphosphatase